VAVELFREGKPLTLQVTLSSTASSAAVKPKSTSPQSGWFGLTVEEIPKNMRIKGLAGVLVAEVEEEGIGAEAGIQRGDIIVAINQKRVATLNDYGTAMKEAERKGSVAILVKRGENSIYFALKIK
jgi:S1-C subfamily serine protease